MPVKPEMLTVDEVLEYYDQQKEAQFAVYVDMLPVATKRRYLYDQDDKIEGRQILQEALTALANNRHNTNAYNIAILRPVDKRHKSKQTGAPEGFEIVNGSTFKFNQSEFIPYQPQIIAGNDREISNLRSEIAALKMQLAGEDMEDDQEEPEDENILSGILKNPEIQKNLVMGLMSLFNGNTGAKVTNLAGIPEDQEDKIYAAIEVLKEADPNLADSLTKLANIAVNNPTQFKMLLSMLPK